MQFTIIQEILIKNLKITNNLLIKNIKYPILENILIEIYNNTLSITSTNLDTEIITKTKKIYNCINGKITISGRKILNICKNMNKNTEIFFLLIKNKMQILTKKSKFLILTLPSEDFPKIYSTDKKKICQIAENKLKYMIFKTQFSMGITDIRYYLNGMLLKVKNNIIFIVTTDGFRLALCSIKLKIPCKNYNIIIPRKSILELYKLLNDTNTQLINLYIGKNNIHIIINNITFISKLIEGSFPNYNNVILKKIKYKAIIQTNKLKKALLRTSIFCHEKFHGIKMHIINNKCYITTNNQEEQIYETINVISHTKNMMITANVNFILDVLSVTNQENISFSLYKNNSKIQIYEKNNFLSIFIIMPINL